MRVILGEFNSETLAVSTSAVLVKGVAATRSKDARKSLLIKAGGAVFVGGKSVTAANGIPLNTGDFLTFEAIDGLYAIATGATTLYLLEGF